MMLENNGPMGLEYPNMMLSNSVAGQACFLRNHDNDHCSMGKRGISLIQPAVRCQPKLTDWLLLEGRRHQHEQQESHRKRRRLQSSTTKSVKFCNEVDVREYSYPIDEVQKSWYSDRDYKRFVEDCRNVILRRADDGKFRNVRPTPQHCDEGTSCIRGLEDQLVPRINRLKVKRRRGLIKMVVRQHVIDKMIGTTDAGSIRCISSSFSSDSKQRALDLAACDEAFVRNSLTVR